MAPGGIDKNLLAMMHSPSYVVDERLLEKNLACLKSIHDRTGVKILLALKAFAMHATFPLMRQYLNGVCASGLHEARLGKEKFGKEVHVYAPAYPGRDLDAILKVADHVVFNSVAQWERSKDAVRSARKPVSCGLRVNPEYSEVKTPLYDPCNPGSRLGIVASELHGIPGGIEGIHFHCLCEQGADALERVFAAVEAKFGSLLHGLKWINLGGGHLITKPGYDIDKLCNIVSGIKTRYDIDVYIEPGEAIVYDAGFLLSTVVDIINRPGMDIAILDTSAAAHMPDVLEMPYRPDVAGAGRVGEFPHTYRLGGISCLAGDTIGEYSFPGKLARGDRLLFTDMAHYSMVKNNTFNGIPLPSLCIVKRDGRIKVVRKFGYRDFIRRLS